MNKRVAVIGAGLAGMAAAIRLARLGFQVQVFEQNTQPGGKMNEYAHDGFRFDTGPSLLTMPFVVDELFQEAGERREDLLNFEPIDPVCRYYFSDGSLLDTFNDRPMMYDAISRYDSRELDGYRKFMAYSAGLYQIAGKAFLYNPIHEIKKMVNLKMLPLFLKSYKIDAFRTMHEGIQSFFTNPNLIQLFDRYATYNGSDPYQAPATLNIIPFVEHELGSCYIRGGIYELVKMLAHVMLKNGVELHYAAPVHEIQYHRKKVKGVQTINGSYQADYVVCNMDVISAHNSIISGLPRMREKYSRLEPSLAGMVFLWGVDGHHPELSHHNILFSTDYALEFKQMFREHIPANDGTVYIAITSRTDATHAPDGCENWFVLVNMPWLYSGQNWQAIVEQTRTMVLNRLRKLNIDVTGKIRFEKVLTPEFFSKQYNAYQGSIYGISSNNRFSAFMRPANRSREIEGLYFAGGSAHPGGGIPLVLLSARFVTDLIAEKEGLATGSFKH